jgi:hypothetical protein
VCAAEPFQSPVDWKTMGLLDYPKVIKTPMDLRTVRAKLERGDYASSKEFRHDVNLVWTNCKMYNAVGSGIYLIASNLMKLIEDKYSEGGFPCKVKECGFVAVSKELLATH